MKLAIEVDIPSVTCVGCGGSIGMEVKAIIKDASDGDVKWKPSIVIRPVGWKSVPHSTNTALGLCPECAERWVPVLERELAPAALPPMRSQDAAKLREQVRDAVVAQLPRGVVPPTPPPPIGAPPPILIDSRPKTTNIPPPAPSAVAKSVVPNLAPPMSARPTFTGSVSLAQAPVHVSSAKVEHVKQQAAVSPIPQLVPIPPPSAPPPAIMSKVTVAPAPQPAVPVDPTKTGEWIRPESEGR